GSGAIRTLPAHRTGPSASPLGRSIVKVRCVTSVADSAGVPSSRAVIRSRYRSLFEVPPRFHVYERMEPGSVATEVQVCPPSELVTWPSVHIELVVPPAEIGAISSSAPPFRWGVYATPPV